MKRLVSIVIPFCNNAGTLGRTLDSLSAIAPASAPQTEVILVDDGSEDGSGEIARKRIAMPGTVAFELLRQENRGTAAARNAALAKSRGEWIFFLDADDELSFDPVPLVRRAGGASAFVFPVRIARDGRHRVTRGPVFIHAGNHLDIFTAGNALTVSSILFRRDAVEHPFDPDLRLLEDWQFWIENPAIFRSVMVHPEIVSAVIHAGGTGKTADRAAHGRYRTIVAERLIAEREGALSAKQRNNLAVQAHIGRIMQGRSMPYRSVLLFPVSLRLYLKFLVYVFLFPAYRRFDLYRA